LGLTMKERRPVYREFGLKYCKAKDKKSKMIILDHFVETTGLHRNYAGYLLRKHNKITNINHKVRVKGDIRKELHKHGRCRRYDEHVFKGLLRIWRIQDFICGKRLAPIMNETLDNLKKHNRLNLTKDVESKLRQISASSIDRLLVKERKRLELKGRSGTKPGTLLKHLIPIRTFADWNENMPGFLEIDLVGHDGGNSYGDFAQTLDMTDVCTGWTETAAIPTKASVWVLKAIVNIKKKLPFPLLGLDSDSGSEFINRPMLNYCSQEGITFTRGRSTRSNDNCYVEQKNYSIVRKTVGYNRYDTIREVEILNDLYGYLRLYTNHFQPVMKLIEKKRIGSKVYKKYDKPKTPYQRIVESSKVDIKSKLKLQKIHNDLDLYDLKKNITFYQKELFIIQKKKHF